MKWRKRTLVANGRAFLPQKFSNYMYDESEHDPEHDLKHDPEHDQQQQQIEEPEKQQKISENDEEKKSFSQKDKRKPLLGRIQPKENKNNLQRT